jgi:DNA-binding Xre family transcriptional regulator
VNDRPGIKENIIALLQSDISAYKISKETGIPQSTLSKIKKGKIDVGKITLDNALKLNEFFLDNKVRE